MVKINAQSRKRPLSHSRYAAGFAVLTLIVVVVYHFIIPTSPDYHTLHQQGGLLLQRPGQEPAPTIPAISDTNNNLRHPISCGHKLAPSCVQCLDMVNVHDQPHSALWEHCNGDCLFDAQSQTCQPRPGRVSCGGHMADSCAGCLDGGKHPPSWCNGDCRYNHDAHICAGVLSYVHPGYLDIFQKYNGFQQVRNQKGELVNIILVKKPMEQPIAWQLVEQYGKDILFMGISSFEAFPLSSPNPYSQTFSNNLYRNVFPAWLTMMRNPEEYFGVPNNNNNNNNNTRAILLSQSDFQLDGPLAFGKRYETIFPKKYDFVYSGTDQNVLQGCRGWASFAKNWTFMLEALEVMCSPEFNLTGVLIANKDKSGNVACWIPESCRDKVVQTTFLPNQTELYEYTVQSHFMMVPNVYDASPRVVSQSLALNVPVLMNRHIIGGWKYLNEETGEFFTDMSDFAVQLRKIVDKSRQRLYHPRDYMEANYGDAKSGKKWLDFVQKHFADRVKLPPGTEYLVPSGS